MPPLPNKPCDMISCMIMSSGDKNVTQYKIKCEDMVEGVTGDEYS